MNILVAPNSMKGSLSAIRFADLIEQAFNETAPDYFSIRKFPVADGGDGTLHVLIGALKLDVHQATVVDPLGRVIQAKYGYANGIAAIEMANASGVKLLKTDELNPMKTSSFGTGQLLLDAVSKGARKIYVGIGGSATVDGGMGMLEALGFRFLDRSKKPLNGNGENLGRIFQVDASGCLLDKATEIILLGDVDNCLLGREGAARMIGPQKGATPAMVETLEKHLTHFAEIVQRETGIEVTSLKGGGAAGGIPVAFSAFLKAKMVPGADFILDLLSIDEAIKWSDLVITGEGAIDGQTMKNKVPFAVALRAREAGKPVIGIAGSISLKDNDLFDGLFSIVNGPMSLDSAIENVEELTYQLSTEIARLISKLH